MSVCASQGRCERGQPLHERRQPVGRELRLEPLSELRVVRQRLEVEAARHGPQVQPSAADEQRDTTLRGHAGQHLPGVRHEVGQREPFRWIDEVETLVGDARPVGGVYLGRADVQAAIHLPRIGRDDRRGPAFCDERLRQPDPELGLAGRGRARDDDERWGVGHLAILHERCPSRTCSSPSRCATRP